MPPAAGSGTPRFTLAEDHRVASVGRLLRNSSLDELLQLRDVVVRGQMSQVSPRAPIPLEFEHFRPH